MTVIFIWPLVFSVFAAFMLATGDHGLGTKIMVCAMVAASLLLQFVVPLPDVPRLLAPLALQLIVIGWWYFASQFE